MLLCDFRDFYISIIIQNTFILTVGEYIKLTLFVSDLYAAFFGLLKKYNNFHWRHRMIIIKLNFL
jgi:hypothetical protein